MSWRSMRFRMTVIFMLVMTPFLLLATHLVFLDSRHNHSVATKKLISESLEIGITSLGEADWNHRLTLLFSSPRLVERQVGAMVTDPHGHVLWKTQSYAPDWPSRSPDTTVSATRGSLSLHIGFANTVWDESEGARPVILLSGAVVIAFGIGVWLLIGKTLSPIRALALQAAAASAEDLETRLVPPSQDAEMRELVATLNGFLDRMAEASEERGRFYAAASHELRTPLQALSGHLEVALSQPRSGDDYQATVREALTQTQRLTSLVEGILLLHQLQGRSVAERESVCVGSVVEEVLLSLQPLIETRNLTCRVSMEPDVRVESVPSHVTVLVRNLLENAAKYGREGGEFNVILEPGPRLRVENTAPDDRAVEVDRLFEPFYRRDASRSTKSGGNGLGLAICQAIAKANGWRLTLEENRGLIVAEVRVE